VASVRVIGYNVSMLWFGMVGRNGSGKSSVCEYLQKKGFYSVSLSDVVRYHARKQNRPDDRDTLTQLANALKKERGCDYLAIASLAHASGHARVVFDSIRHPAEVQALTNRGVVMVGIDASLAQCYERIQSRGKGTDGVSFEAFKQQDAYEMSGASYGQHISTCLDLCDVRITNNGTLTDLFDCIDAIIEEANSGK
jgi:dephospho-CoA kinase